MSHAASSSGQSDDLVITLGPHSAAALILGNLRGHPLGPGVVLLVSLVVAVVVLVSLVMAVVGVLRDLHSLKISLHLTRSKAGDAEVVGLIVAVVRAAPD